MNKEEIVNSQDYKATKAALEWWYLLPEEQRKATDIDAEPDIVDAYADGVIYGWNNPNWIPVEERLPKFDEQVLVYGLCPNGCRLFYVDCLIQDINDNGYPKWDDDTIIPTHWMPIVPPRKEENNDCTTCQNRD